MRTGSRTLDLKTHDPSLWYPRTGASDLDGRLDGFGEARETRQCELGLIRRAPPEGRSREGRLSFLGLLAQLRRHGFAPLVSGRRPTAA